MKLTCNNIFSVIAIVITGISIKFHENILNLSVEIEKNTENMLSPPKKTNSKRPKANTPRKVFQSDNHWSIIKNISAKFHKKPNISQDIEKNTTRKPKKYPKVASRREGLTVKIFENQWSNKKTPLQTFMRKGLIALNKQRMSPKRTTKGPK